MSTETKREPAEERFRAAIGRYETVDELVRGMRTSAAFFREKEPVGYITQPKITADFHDRVAAALERALQAISHMGEGEKAVAWRVKDYADGWMVFSRLWQAEEFASNGNLLQPLYLHSAPAGESEIRVKALIWIEDGTGHWKSGAASIGSYHIVATATDEFDLRMSWSFMASGGIFSSIDEAKAAAQADYEARIRSAIEGGKSP